MAADPFTLFEDGILATTGARLELGAIPWVEHPKFAGVYLKDIVTKEMTRGKCTCHLVRIEPTRSIGRHLHPDSFELHEVIGGEGTCLLESGSVFYKPGTMAVLPNNVEHEVRAGEKGLLLFAKFFAMAD